MGNKEQVRKKQKAVSVSFRKWKNAQAVWGRLNCQTQNWSGNYSEVRNHCFFLNLGNPVKKMLFRLPSKLFNPLTPLPPVIGCDKPWPFFHFWHHHFWPKLASSTLKFRKRKRSFQWCPDQSDQANEAWDMHKNAQNMEWKTLKKISCHYTWLLYGKNCPSF